MAVRNPLGPAVPYHSLEQIAPDWNRGAIQGRVNLLVQTTESVFIQGEHALEQIAPDWNRGAIQGRVNLLVQTTESVFS
jgi:hypothetical protein